MEPKRDDEYSERLERRITILEKENAALTVTVGKVMRENMKLKADIQELERELSRVNARSDGRSIQDAEGD